jgi:hypothetical protein
VTVSVSSLRSALAGVAMAAAIAITATTLGCSAAHNGSSSRQDPVVDPLVPAVDSVGPAPTRFSWRPVPGAAFYVLGVWNESDALIWKSDEINATSALPPEDVRFEPGTYFWSVVAIRDGQQIATSGHTAFVVTIPAR